MLVFSSVGAEALVLVEEDKGIKRKALLLELAKCKENNFNVEVECSKLKDILKMNDAEHKNILKIYHVSFSSLFP